MIWKVITNLLQVGIPVGIGASMARFLANPISLVESWQELGIAGLSISAAIFFYKQAKSRQDAFDKLKDDHHQQEVIRLKKELARKELELERAKNEK